MRRIVIINQQLVWVEGGNRFLTTEELLGQNWTSSGTLLIGIVPSQVGRVLATTRTLDSAVSTQYPGEFSYSTHLLEQNVHQVYVAPDELLNRLRKMARDVRLVPYPAAVQTVVVRKGKAPTLAERTSIFLKTGSIIDLAEVGKPQEMVVIDSFGDEDMLMTAVRGEEVVAVRYAQGDVVTELQRTLAAARLDAPVIVCQEHSLSLELQAQGFSVEETEAKGALIGVAGLKKVEHLRFLNQFEVAQKRAAETRRHALVYLGIATAALLVTGAAFLFFSGRAALGARKRVELTATKAQETEALTNLYRERFGTTARSQSLQIREELFDLQTVLPQQVVMLSVTKNEQGLSAVVERRPQAAPFSTDDLRSVLQSSTFFAKAQISEEYDGHLIRYLLKVPLAPPPGTGAPAGP